jgi:hypothetical protein
VRAICARVEHGARHRHGCKQRAWQERPPGLLHQQHQFDDAEADATVRRVDDDAGVALCGQLGPELGVVRGSRFGGAPDDRHRTLAGKELARAVAQDGLVLVESEVH